MYVLRRTDQGGGWVTPAGSHRAYTHSLLKARIYNTKQEAESDRCVGNEVVEDVLEILSRPTR